MSLFHHCFSINSNRSRYLDPASLWFNKDSRKMVYATSQSACIWVRAILEPVREKKKTQQLVF